jgi:DNA-binding NtrC family response regulator
VENLDSRLLLSERDMVLDALTRAGDRRGKAAEILGISRHSLKRRMQKFGLQADHD